MMLQLVQSPSKRVQRLIRTNCASDGETTSITAQSNKATGETKKRVPQQGRKLDIGDEEEDNDDANQSRNQDDPGTPLTRGARSSSSTVVSSSKSSDGDGPTVTRVDKFTNRDGSLFAASASSYTSKRAQADNEELDDDVDDGHEDEEDDRH